MTITVFKEFKFSAAHRLNIEGHQCSSVHGHNYKLRIEVTGERGADGFVIDFHEIRDVVSPIVERLDHSLLNDFIDDTTSEGLCVWILREIGDQIKGISRIEVRETDSCGAFVTVTNDIWDKIQRGNG